MKLESFLRDKFVPHRAIWEGGRPKTQLMDIVSGLSLFVEKALDLFFRGAIAQEDVQQHYDTMSCIRIYRWLIRNGCPVPLAVACLRHQLLPPLTLNLHGATASICNRCRGGLTGSRVAGQMGRVPVQATIHAILPSLMKNAWSCEDVTLAVASYVDNVWFLSETAYHATAMADLFASHLLQHWGQRIKPCSKQVLPVFNAPDDSITDDSWEVVSVMRVLGHLIDSNGSIDEDFKLTQKKMWRAFWSNAGTLSARHLPLRCKLSLLTRATRCIADQHMVRWPFTAHRAGTVDRMQRKMLQVCEFLRPSDGESVELFCKRRGRSASRLQQRVGRWSVRWAA